MIRSFSRSSILFALAAALVLIPGRAAAHCDTLDGPVIQDARAALGQADVTPVLKWVRPADEPEIRAAFARTLAVRAAGAEPASLADLWFFENLVRIHRAGEGAAYDGLKPAGAVEPGIAAADAAIAHGSATEVADRAGEQARHAILHRFERLTAAKAHAGESVEQGRAYVAAYVEFIHFVENLDRMVGSAPAAVHHH